MNNNNNSITPAVEAIGIAKNYGPVNALQPTSFSIMSGQYYVLLGPSGGGKTTTLRLIGGLVKPSQGQVLLNGENVTRRPPNKRDTSMVFQSYALFPHMTVEQNVAYGLQLRKLGADEIEHEVNAMLELVGLTGYNQRLPHELSGGQQQRVQLARSLVLKSAILLLDEPLAALDAKLRKSMCYELKRIQEQVGITFIHVTHNQEEAMTIADRIAIIANGELIEEGSVRDVYERPQRRFTADFIGENTLLEGKVTEINGDTANIDLDFATVNANTHGHTLAPQQNVTLSIRPEIARITLSAQVDLQTIPATFLDQVYLGFMTTTRVQFSNGQQGLVRTLNSANEQALSAGQQVHFAWSTDDARLHTQ